MSEKKSWLKIIKQLIYIIIWYSLLYVLFTMMIIIFKDHIIKIMLMVYWLYIEAPLYARLTSILIITICLAWYHKDKWWK